jgi:hypothetical protein
MEAVCPSETLVPTHRTTTTYRIPEEYNMNLQSREHQEIYTGCEIIGYDLDRLCVLVVRVPGYRSRGPGFDSRRHQIFWEVVGLERGPFSLVRIIEELLEWKSSGSGLENWY